ncbi:MAG: LPS export ABC transporter permease LptG [Burkholderiales bacterium]
MKVFRRYLAREIYGATLFVFAAFLALFAFFDLINELGDIGKGSYRLQHALLYVALIVPTHIYELFPIAVLIGTLYVLSRLAANSEYTVMRAAGLSPGGTASMLLRVGIVFALLTFLFGELVAPYSDRSARQLKLQATSAVVAQEFRTGVWLRDEGRFVNVREVLPDTTLSGIRIFAFDRDYKLQALIDAKKASFSGAGSWMLEGVAETRFTEGRVAIASHESLAWRSVLTPDILSVLFVQPERMSAWNLYQYSRHLGENRQKTERYQIAMWKKLVYPIAVLVMMALALPFAYLHVRAGGVGVKVFTGIMIGIFFHMLNSLFSHIGLLQGWAPFSSAILPSALFLLTAMLMMWWVERR